MTREELLEAARVLNLVSKAFADCPEEKEKSLEASLFLTLANYYIVELASHIGDGDETYDAVVKTVRGELVLPESKQTLLKILGH